MIRVEHTRRQAPGLQLSQTLQRWRIPESKNFKNPPPVAEGAAMITERLFFNDDPKLNGDYAVFLRSKEIFYFFIKNFFHAGQ